MRVWIDQDLCTGDGLCEDHCPEVFTLLEDGIAWNLYAQRRGRIRRTEARTPKNNYISWFRGRGGKTGKRPRLHCQTEILPCRYGLVAWP